MRGRLPLHFQCVSWTGRSGCRNRLRPQHYSDSTGGRPRRTIITAVGFRTVATKKGSKSRVDADHLQFKSRDPDYIKKVQSMLETQPDQTQPELKVQWDPHEPLFPPQKDSPRILEVRKMAMGLQAATFGLQDESVRSISRAAARHITLAPIGTSPFTLKTKKIHMNRHALKLKITHSKAGPSRRGFATGPPLTLGKSRDAPNPRLLTDEEADSTIPTVIRRIEVGSRNSVLEARDETGFRNVAAKRIDNETLVNRGWWRHIPPAYLRDSCMCKSCVDPHSGQKNFQTTDIPDSIEVRDLDLRHDGSIEIKWTNDVPGWHKDHTTSIPVNFFKDRSGSYDMAKALSEREIPDYWDKNKLTKKIKHISYESFLNVETESALWLALQELLARGIVIIQDVPSDQGSVSTIAERIGTLRDSFYGRTWDVRSIPEAANVAYTSKYLGLHMDLLYMAEPPGFQLLHCMKNTAEGGESIFSDSFHAVNQLSRQDLEELATGKLTYHYRKGGQHYNHSHPVIKRKSSRSRHQIDCINYSPPFQGYSAIPDRHYEHFTKALKAFAAGVESEANLFEYKLDEGECVIFNNRRVLHGRRQFSMEGGERWLRGCYLDTDVFMSRYRVVKEKMKGEDPQTV